MPLSCLSKLVFHSWVHHMSPGASNLLRVAYDTAYYESHLLSQGCITTLGSTWCRMGTWMQSDVAPIRAV